MMIIKKGREISLIPPEELTSSTICLFLSILIQPRGYLRVRVRVRVKRIVRGGLVVCQRTNREESETLGVT